MATLGVLMFAFLVTSGCAEGPVEPESVDVLEAVAAQSPGQIAFESDRDGNDEIYVMAADGSGQTNLTNDPDGDFGPEWSTTGR